jgi:hypothetical protein
MRSTSGIFLCLRAGDSFVPLSGISKRQSCVSISTLEAEIVAANQAVRQCGLPALVLWEQLLGRSQVVRFHEDNQPVIKVIESGNNKALRHTARTHKVSVSWLHERFKDKDLALDYIQTNDQAADVFTKSFTDKQKWKHACELINHVQPSEFWPGPPPRSGGGFIRDFRAQKHTRHQLKQPRSQMSKCPGYNPKRRRFPTNLHLKLTGRWQENKSKAQKKEDKESRSNKDKSTVSPFRKNIAYFRFWRSMSGQRTHGRKRQGLAPAWEQPATPLAQELGA